MQAGLGLFPCRSVKYFGDLRIDKLLFCRDPGGSYFAASEDRASERLVTSFPLRRRRTAAYKAALDP